LKYLPSKKLILSILIILSASLGGFWFLKQKKPYSYSIPNQEFLEKIAENASLLDSDKDGLKDWEEVLWKTDPNNPDTDGDGVLDGEEVKLGRNPVISGPNDELSDLATGLETESSIGNPASKFESSLNFTQEFAKGLSIQAVSGEQADFSAVLNSLEHSAAQGMAEFIAKLNPQISAKELKTSNDNSFEAIQKYADEVSKAIPKNPYPQKTEDDVFAKAMQTKDFSIIDEYIDYYDEAINNMKAIVAPYDFLDIHKREIELFMATKMVYESVKEVETDPLKTVLALKQNEKIREEMSELLVDFLEFVQEHIE
jgi:hypothetical protein